MMKLKIAIQKSGRLHDESLKLLKDCGISIDNGRDQLKAAAKNFPMEIYYLRNGDIPQYLKDGVVDCAIIGENLLIEKGNDIAITEKLGFSKCRVSLAVSKIFEYDNIKDLEGKRIATSYPVTTGNYLKEQGVNAELHIINGSVEIAPNIGLADAICDIVSSGSTLFKNNLKEVEVIMKSQAVLAASPQISESLREILNKFRFRIQSVLKGRDYRYVLLNAPNENLQKIIDILPGMKSPTVLPLAEEGWSSIHSVVNQDMFWEVIDSLKTAGAEGILVCPIEKMVM
ncbi:MAG: ATP phosphoribosyltransferase [Bacteroidia bacterium]|nr:ATP phosphoribosyltransferase [Bacteroidia bacterium]NNF30017.1 ATP phosphoribosyltransferase [Flavobacteriaceae bacterium]MBT8274740.1 ATP phosphoribosyltransferase [Bacteroidia bacterium]NNJ81492.1 ATP phosphoribosyltransferase [Flavobacteriaceae bacterium]NNK53722.1 ATP phosphoribosyltransferase [Flavobacteriaceae bacterium]